MTANRQGEKNIKMTFDFLRKVVDDPAILDSIPNHATIVFLPEDDPKQFEANVQLAIRSAREGKNVYLHHVKTISLT